MDTDTPFIARLLSNYWIVFFIFVLTGFILHLILVRWRKLGKIAWKYIDYIWLAFATLGLLSATAEVRRFTASSIIDQKRASARTDYRIVVMTIDQGADYIWCRELNGTLSPIPGIDKLPGSLERHKIYKPACDYFKSLQSKFPNDNISELKPVRFPNNLLRPNVIPQDFRPIFDDLDRAIETYNQSVSEYQKVNTLRERTSAEEILIVWGPILIAFALALRITKVTGEIKLEKMGAEEKKIPVLEETKTLETPSIEKGEPKLPVE